MTKQKDFIEQKRKMLEALNRKQIKDLIVEVEGEEKSEYSTLKDEPKIIINTNLKKYLENEAKEELEFAYRYITRKDKLVHDGKIINTPRTLLYPLNLTLIIKHNTKTDEKKLAAIKKAKEQELVLKRELMKLATSGNEFAVMYFINEKYDNFKMKVDNFLAENDIGYFTEIFHEQNYNLVGDHDGKIIVFEFDDTDEDFLRVKAALDAKAKASGGSSKLKMAEDEAQKANIRLRFSAALINADLNGASKEQIDKIQNEYKTSIANLLNTQPDKVEPLRQIIIDRSRMNLIQKKI